MEVGEKYRLKVIRYVKFMFFTLGILILIMIPSYFIENHILKDDFAMIQLYWMLFMLFFGVPISLIYLVYSVKMIIQLYGSNKFNILIDIEDVITVLEKEGFVNKDGKYLKYLGLNQNLCIEIIENNEQSIMKTSSSMKEGIFKVKIFRQPISPKYNQRVYYYLTQILSDFPTGSFEEIQ